MEQKKKKFIAFAALAVVILVVVLALTQCGDKAPEWQEQYDLGLRYLNEGNYEEAILAFSAAIEIDPNVSEHYLYRGDAYVMGAEDYASREDYDMAQEYLQKAEDDYNKAQVLAPENGEISDRLEDLEELEDSLVPEEIPFYEEMGLEINTTPDSTEITEEGVLRHASWTTTVTLPVTYRYDPDGDGTPEVAEVEYLPSDMTLNVTEYFGVDMSWIIEKLWEENRTVFTEFLASHPDYKVIVAEWIREVGPDREDARGKSWTHSLDIYDRNERYLNSAIVDAEGNDLEYLVLHSVADVWEGENEIDWSTIYLVAVVPVDYDGAMFYIWGDDFDDVQAIFAFPAEEG